MATETHKLKGPAAELTDRLAKKGWDAYMAPARNTSSQRGVVQRMRGDDSPVGTIGGVAVAGVTVMVIYNCTYVVGADIGACCFCVCLLVGAESCRGPLGAQLIA